MLDYTKSSYSQGYFEFIGYDIRSSPFVVRNTSPLELKVKKGRKERNNRKSDIRRKYEEEERIRKIAESIHRPKNTVQKGW